MICNSGTRGAYKLRIGSVITTSGKDTMIKGQLAGDTFRHSRGRGGTGEWFNLRVIPVISRVYLPCAPVTHPREKSRPEFPIQKCFARARAIVVFGRRGFVVSRRDDASRSLLRASRDFFRSIVIYLLLTRTRRSAYSFHHLFMRNTMGILLPFSEDAHERHHSFIKIVRSSRTRRETVAITNERLATKMNRRRVRISLFEDPKVSEFIWGIDISKRGA